MAGMFEQPRNAGTLFLGGTKISGADIRDQNGACALGVKTYILLMESQSLQRKLLRMSSKALSAPQGLTR